MADVIPFPTSRPQAAAHGQAYAATRPMIGLDQRVLVEQRVAFPIERHGADAAGEALLRRNQAWQGRDFDAAERWSAVPALLDRVDAC